MSIAQYGEKIGPFQWRGKLTQHTYDSPEAMVHYEKQEALKAQARAQRRSPLDRLSTAEVEELTKAFVYEIAEAERQTEFNDVADIFLIKHPEFVNSPANGTAMATALTMMGKKHTATALDMEEAYQVLCDNNSLQLDQKVLAEQRIERLEAQANEPSNPQYSGRIYTKCRWAS